MVRFCIAILLATVSSLELIPRPKELTLGADSATIERCSIQLSSEPALQPLAEVYLPFLSPSSRCLSSDRSPFTIYLKSDDSAKSCTSEYYELTITQEEARLTAPCTIGLIRAFASLIQIFGANNDNIALTSLPIRIKDSPRFSHRGLMIDSARRFLPKKLIFRLIDAMMLGKFNVLHWHIADDDSFPLHLKSYPDLAKDTAFGANMIYTPEDVKEIISYAEIKGIRVVPNVDSLSHVRAIGMHKPLNDLVTCFNSSIPYDVKDVYKIKGGPANGIIDPSMNKAYEFLRSLLKDVTSYFKDQYIHLGGDDIRYVCWDERPEIHEFMRLNNIIDYDALMAYYFNKEQAILKEIDASKKAVYWLSEKEFTVKHNPNAILQYWGLSKNINRLRSLYPTNQFILSPQDFAYLDCGNENAFGGMASCAPFHTWATMYNFEPTNYSLPENRILGGEVAAWSEALNEDNIEAKIWPRAISFAAVLWEPKRTGLADLPKLVQDINAFSMRLKELGMRTSPVTGKFCELKENICFVHWK